MKQDKWLGKIEQCRIGSGGYQDAMFGISFTLSGSGLGVGDFWGAWGPGIEVGEGTKWTEQDRRNQLADAFLNLAKLMEKAKVSDAKKLIGVPVEVTTENNTLKSWRILEEVL